MNDLHTEEEIENTNWVSSMCEQYNILDKPRLPPFECPSGFNVDEYLRQLCRNGWRDKISNIIPKDQQDIYAERIKSELGILQSAGLSSYSVTIFHLSNHAFFKALLFLGAGSVIHALSDEQDMRKMGGLIKILPFTYTAMLVGSMALMGFPFLTGFYSKDVILEVAYGHFTIEGKFVHILGNLAAFFTAYYSTRLISLTFLRPVNGAKIAYEHVHESPLKMALPLFLLSFASIFVGYLSRDMFIGLGTDF
jgi:NADH-ubiquinone oxidoreductase chain 5